MEDGVVVFMDGNGQGFGRAGNAGGAMVYRPKKGADCEVRPMLPRGDERRGHGSLVGTRYCVLR
ncbi:MAG: hypothetical protein RLZZ162_3979 [Verrucomicrobiota bacterium]|jgi:hypothetical protein